MPAADANTYSYPDGDSYSDDNTEPNTDGYCYSQGYPPAAADPAPTSESAVSDGRLQQIRLQVRPSD